MVKVQQSSISLTWSRSSSHLIYMTPIFPFVYSPGNHCFLIHFLNFLILYWQTLALYLDLHQQLMGTFLGLRPILLHPSMFLENPLTVFSVILLTIQPPNGLVWKHLYFLNFTAFQSFIMSFSSFLSIVVQPAPFLCHRVQLFLVRELLKPTKDYLFNTKRLTDIATSWLLWRPEHTPKLTRLGIFFTFWWKIW